MTPKEKAIQLVAKYKSQSFGITTNFQHFKQCALIAVNELIYFGNTELLSEMFEGDYYCDVDFFEEVKKEIEKL